MNRNKRKMIRIMGSIICAGAVLLSGIPDFNREVSVQAAETIDYYEQEGDQYNTNSSFDAPEQIQVNQLCAGTIGGVLSEEIANDYEDVYQVNGIEQADFTNAKRGRFHVELTIAEGDIRTLSLTVYTSDMGVELFSGKTSKSIVTPSYSVCDPVKIDIRDDTNIESPISYTLKVVYDSLEGSWAETELNTTVGNAARIQPNENYWGCTHDTLYSNRKWYCYTLDEPGNVSVSLKPQDGKKQIVEDLWQLLVYTEDGDSENDTELGSGTLAAGVQSETYHLDAGTYYIAVVSLEETALWQVYDLKVNYQPDTPAVSEKPPVSEEPSVTEEPSASGAPNATEKPSVSGTPNATEKPSASGTPSVTEKPSASGAPNATEKPTASGTPGATEKPSVSGNQNANKDNAVSSKDSSTAQSTEEQRMIVQNQIKKITTTKIVNVTLQVSTKKGIALKWKRNKVAQGYKIYRSNQKKKGFRCIKTIKKNKSTKWKDSNVKSGKTYYYKLRAYKKVGKKTYYSKYTKTLKAKAK